jgi:hypothetical protein
MTSGKRTEGPCAPLFFSAAVTLLLLIASPASSQSVDLSALELCAGLEAPELRLACFEAIVAGSKAPEVREAKLVEEPVNDQPAAEAVAAPAAVSAVVAASAATPEPAPAAAATPVPEQIADQVDVKPEVAPAVSVAVTSEPAAVSDFGQEYLVQPEKKEGEHENEILRATVTNVTKGRNDVLYFHLDNGHVWRQLEARHFQYPRNSEFDINITRGMMGEYRMRIGDNGRMVRIRRVE